MLESGTSGQPTLWACCKDPGAPHSTGGFLPAGLSHFIHVFKQIQQSYLEFYTNILYHKKALILRLNADFAQLYLLTVNFYSFLLSNFETELRV